MHHHAPEEMQNEDVAHEHSDINISALVWSWSSWSASWSGTRSLMALLFGSSSARPRPGIRSSRRSRCRRRRCRRRRWRRRSSAAAGPEADDGRAGAPQGACGPRSRRSSHGYGWVDEKAGVAHIPIDEAKKLIARARPARASRAADGSAVGTRVPASRRIVRRAETSRARCAPAAPERLRRRRPRARSARKGVRGSTRDSSNADKKASDASQRAYVGARRHACDGVAPNPGGLVEPGDPTTARPGILSKIGDRSAASDQQLPLDLPFIDENGPRGDARRLLRQAAGRSGARVLRVPDAVHAGAQRPGRGARRAQLRRRPRVRRRRGQLQPEGRSRARGAEEGELRRALRAAAGGCAAGTS